MSDTVGIAMVNYKQPKLTIECIESILASTFKDVEIIVVDNESQDGSVEQLKEYFGDKIHLIEAGGNIGFAKGTNLGMSAAYEMGCSHIMMLNNDTLIDEHMIEILVKRSNDHDAITTPLMFDKTGEVIWYAGGDLGWKGVPTHRAEGKKESEIPQLKESLCSFATGCCIMIPRRILEAGHYLPEEYFLYYEDYDYCRLLEQLNEQIWFIPEARLLHKVSSSTAGTESPLVLYYGTRNRLYANRKYLSGMAYVKFRCYFVMTRLIKMVNWSIKGESDKNTHLLAGIRDYRLGITDRRP